MPGAAHFQVLTAAGSEGEAAAIADALLERRLAACVQVLGPVRSRYRWKGRVESAEEWLVVAKTTAAAVEEAMDEIGRRHSYDEPEVTATPIVAGSAGYLAWIDAEVAPPAAPQAPPAHPGRTLGP
ncbi:MAG: divalent-cation tolerance protein CutA [Acidimicrobiia bacterium]